MRLHLIAEFDEVARYLNQTATAVGEAGDQATYRTTEETKDLGRVHVASALTPRAGNLLGSRYFFDTEGGRVRPVGFVHGRWWRRSAAGQRTDILHEYETGATIVPIQRKALAIPTPEGLRIAGSVRGSRLSPEKFKEKTGLELKSVEINGVWFLVAEGYVTKRNRVYGFKGGPRRTRGGYKQGAASVFVFRLTKQTRLPKRLDIAALRRRSQVLLGRNYLEELARRGLR